MERKTQIRSLKPWNVGRGQKIWPLPRTAYQRRLRSHISRGIFLTTKNVAQVRRACLTSWMCHNRPSKLAISKHLAINKCKTALTPIEALKKSHRFEMWRAVSSRTARHRLKWSATGKQGGGSCSTFGTNEERILNNAVGKPYPKNSYGLFCPAVPLQTLR